MQSVKTFAEKVQTEIENIENLRSKSPEESEKCDTQNSPVVNLAKNGKVTNSDEFPNGKNKKTHKIL